MAIYTVKNCARAGVTRRAKRPSAGRLDWAGREQCDMGVEETAL